MMLRKNHGPSRNRIVSYSIIFLIQQQADSDSRIDVHN